MIGIPIIQPIPLHNDPAGPTGSPQAIIQLKELKVDEIRYNEWKARCKRERETEAEAAQKQAP